MIWQPGKVHNIADALSRAPIFTANEEDEDNSEITIRAIAESNPNLAILQEAAELDETYQSTINALNENNLKARYWPFIQQQAMCKVFDLLISLGIIGFICLLLFIYYEEASNYISFILSQLKAEYYSQ